MRALLWSVRRELWEHRWVYMVPAVVGGVLIAVMGGTLLFGSSANNAGISRLFDHATRMLLLMGTVSTYVYCAEALHTERRDGSIIFWKALPVSDAIAVLGKAAVALVVMPLLTLATLLVAQGIAHIASLRTGVPLTALLASPWGAALEVLASAIWIAPVYAWLLLVSAWVRRAVLLMAFLPAFLISIVEQMVTGRHTIARELFKRGVGRHWPSGLGGPLSATSDGLIQTPAHVLLVSWSLWAGALLAALLLALAVMARRRQLARS